MSRLYNLNVVISCLNNAVSVNKVSFFIKNTSYNLNFVKLLYSKNYIKYYSILSKNRLIIYLSTACCLKKIILISKVSLLIYAKNSFLKFYVYYCQPLTYTFIISTTFGLLFLEEALFLNCGGLLLCYLK